MIKALLALQISLSAALAQSETYVFAKADSVAGLYPNHELTDLKKLADKLTLPLSTDIDKIRSLHTWICLNISQDYSLYKRNAFKQAHYTGNKLDSWNRKVRQQVFERLIKKRKTICTGYAYLFRELANYAGFECVIIDGYGRTGIVSQPLQKPNHSWNAFRLNQGWYFCDPTWSSGRIDGHGRYIRHYQDAYFMASPEQFVRNHYPLDSAWLLDNSKSTLQEFLEGPVIYAGFYKKIKSIWPDKYELNVEVGEGITVEYQKFSTISTENEFVLLKFGTESKRIMVQNEGLISGFQYTFRRRGIYHVYLIIDGDFTISYKVIVN